MWSMRNVRASCAAWEGRRNSRIVVAALRTWDGIDVRRSSEERACINGTTVPRGAVARRGGWQEGWCMASSTLYTGATA